MLFAASGIGDALAAKQLDFALVHDNDWRVLLERVRTKAAEQYVRSLAADADILGIDLGAATSGLMQLPWSFGASPAHFMSSG